MKIDFISDINKSYESSLNYNIVDRFILKVLFWNFGIFFIMATMNSIFRMANYYPSPFSWRVISLSEASYAIIVALWITVVPSLLLGRLKNHYIFRVIVTVCLVVYSYLFVFISGGSIEMHFHFFMMAALLVVYADWRLGWILLVLTGLHHGILNYFQPGWVYFYGRNDFSVISHSLPVLGIVIFTTVLSNNSRKLILNFKKTQKSLGEQKKWLEVLLDKLPVGVSVAEAPSGKLTMINKSALNLLGRGIDPNAKKDDYGKVYDVLREDGSPYPVAEMAPVIAMKTGEQITKDDIVIIKPDKAKVLLRATSTPVKNSEGKSTAIVSILEDITKDREERRIIEEEKAKDDATIQSIGEGLIATDEYAKIIKVNKKAEEMMGFTEKELIGRWIVGAFAVYDEKGVPLNPTNHPIIEALITGKLIVSNLQFARKDLTKFIASVAVSPIVFENKPIGAIVVFRDVTHEKEIDRMKTEFISLASHQLRTPLSAIKWNLEELLGEKNKLNIEQKGILDEINKSNERMIALVNSLLNVSRMESGRIIVDPVLTDLNELINEVYLELKPQINAKKQKVKIAIDKKFKSINIDPKLIRQVFLNLLSNSVKYTKDSGEISVNVYHKKGEIISEISDNGYGIPKKDHDKVFQKFYRGDNIIKLSTDGNGLGMYLVKAIIESSKGRIWFESVENKGTTFWFSLPDSGMKAKKGEVHLS